jgi:hypothetical protein
MSVQSKFVLAGILWFAAAVANAVMGPVYVPYIVLATITGLWFSYCAYDLRER